MARKQRRIPKYQQEAEQPNRVPADPSRYAPHNSYSPMPAFYEDVTFQCRDCGANDVWTAEQQKWWYEVAKGPIYSQAVRCRTCRQKRDDEIKGTPRKTQKERRAAELNPDSEPGDSGKTAGEN